MVLLPPRGEITGLHHRLQHPAASIIISNIRPGSDFPHSAILCSGVLPSSSVAFGSAPVPPPHRRKIRPRPARSPSHS